MVRNARKDALENRARIVEAARQEIASSNTTELRLNAIAREAGVGQGTLYRHFPTREALLVEVYRQEVDELVELAPRLLEGAEPVDALARWFDRVAEYARVKRGVLAAVEASVSRDLTTHSLGPIGDALTVLLHAGKTAGQVRDDVDAGDVIILIGYLSRLDEDEWDRRAHRLLRVILDGLRHR
ncbi:TetR/AcrR family transcriptional regulator [Promicromonospora iranensis]|uniref:TetR/AcrR family transcriptional regulator n=1 Tax=Promicromonospora iranensis TaxID=1105144 RepID=UPI0023A94FE4|nr:TetR/AcrR family transcriptional regulator [Promicromonospora iranensis]